MNETGMLLFRLRLGTRRYGWSGLRIRLLGVLARAGLVSVDYFEREVGFQWRQLAAFYEREVRRRGLEDDPEMRRRLAWLRAGPPR